MHTRNVVQDSSSFQNTQKYGISQNTIIGHFEGILEIWYYKQLSVYTITHIRKNNI